MNYLTEKTKSSEASKSGFLSSNPMNLRELESKLKSGVYFDGYPFVDYENKQANWDNFSKGILSSSTNKIWEYVNYRKNELDQQDLMKRKKEQDKKENKKNNQYKEKLLGFQEKSRILNTRPSFLHVDVNPDVVHKMHQNTSKLEFFNILLRKIGPQILIKRRGSYHQIRNPMHWNKGQDCTFIESSSFMSDSSLKSSKISSSFESSEDGDFVDDEDINKVLMKNFKLVRRNSCCCSFCGKEKITPLRKLKETLVLKQQWHNEAKKQAKESVYMSIKNIEELQNLSVNNPRSRPGSRYHSRNRSKFTHRNHSRKGDKSGYRYSSGYRKNKNFLTDNKLGVKFSTGMSKYSKSNAGDTDRMSVKISKSQMGNFKKSNFTSPENNIKKKRFAAFKRQDTISTGLKLYKKFSFSKLEREKQEKKLTTPKIVKDKSPCFGKMRLTYSRPNTDQLGKYMKQYNNLKPRTRNLGIMSPISQSYKKSVIALSSKLLKSAKRKKKSNSKLCSKKGSIALDPYSPRNIARIPLKTVRTSTARLLHHQRLKKFSKNVKLLSSHLKLVDAK
ncbi:unnamed protein product [Moneuplotes crassus]|uniref:Uncharacterized protein n=1 Tax=Euplotes crassus TaxID=5936 RepID=A0AAD2DCF4_EUPCR|nr:unnamed protein product [Moneuplotes crassus]